MTAEAPAAEAHPPAGPLRLVEKTLRHSVPAVALLHFIAFLTVTFSRIGYPYELEWMEGGSLDHVRRILAGEPVYVEPTFEFVPYIYTPFYFWVCAACAKVFGLGFTVMRAVSLVSSLACAALLCAVARSSGCRRPASLLAALLFIAMFKPGGAWYDLARVDMLFLALMFAAWLACVRASGWTGFLVSALLCFLAFATKQTALAGVSAILFILILRDWRRGLVAAALFAGLTGAFCLGMNAATGGWFGYYVFTLPASNPVNSNEWFVSLKWEFVQPLWIGGVIVALHIAASLREAAGRRAAMEHLVFFSAMTVTAWTTRLHQGGYASALIPFYSMLALTTALAWDRIGWRGETSAHLALRCALHMAIIVQLGHERLTYHPMQLVPSHADRHAGDEWVGRIRAVEGDVLVVYSGYLARLAGKESPSPGLAYHIFIGPPEDKLAYLKQIAAAIRSRKYAMIIVPEKWLYSENFRGFIEQEYDRDPAPPPGEDAFYPVTGGEVRPEIMYRLKPR